MGKKVVLPSKPLCQINQSRALFSFPSHDWLSFSQSWCVLYKRTRAQVPMASSIECLSALLICNEAVVICCKNVLDLQGKKPPCIPQGMKKKNIAYQYICQSFQNVYCIICLFWYYAKLIMHSEPIYAMSHPCRILEALFIEAGITFF